MRLQTFAVETLDALADAAPLHPLILELFALSRRQVGAGALFDTYFRTYREALAAILVAAVAKGELAIDDADGAAVTFLTTLEGVLVVGMVAPAAFDLQRDGLKAVEFVLKRFKKIGEA